MFALSVLAGVAVRAGSATSSTPIGSAFLVIALRYADAFTEVVAQIARRAFAADSAAPIGPAFFAFTIGDAVAVAVWVAFVPRRAFAAGASASIRSALFARTTGCTVQALVEFIVAIAIQDGLRRAGFDGFRTAYVQHALPDLNILFLCLRAGVLPAFVGAFFVPFRAVPQAVEQLLAIPGRLALAGHTVLIRSAQSAKAVASVGSALFAVAVGLAGGLA